MTIISSGQTLIVSSGVTSSGLTVLFGGVVEVLSGGVISATVDRGGEDIVSAGGKAFGTTVSNGSEEDVFGSASGTTVSGGGSRSLKAAARPPARQ